MHGTGIAHSRHGHGVAGVQQTSPRHALRPSRTAMAAMISPATGSAHDHPSVLFTTSYVSVNPDGTVLMLHPDEDCAGVVSQGSETYVVPFP